MKRTHTHTKKRKKVIIMERGYQTAKSTLRKHDFIIFLFLSPSPTPPTLFFFFCLFPHCGTLCYNSDQSKSTPTLLQLLTAIQGKRHTHTYKHTHTHTPHFRSSPFSLTFFNHGLRRTTCGVLHGASDTRNGSSAASPPAAVTAPSHPQRPPRIAYAMRA